MRDRPARVCDLSWPRVDYFSRMYVPEMACLGYMWRRMRRRNLSKNCLSDT